MIADLFGWISTLAFSICTIPQAYKSFKEGHSDGLSTSLLVLWTTGEVTGTVYGILLNEWPLIISYGLNVLFVCVLTWYKFFPRKGNV